MTSEPELRAAALVAIRVAEPLAKVGAVRAIAERDLAVDTKAVFAEPPGVPGRLPVPVLVAPADVPRRPVGTREGRAALLHAIAHIEFNAIDLALDAIWRFADLPEEYYRDWLRVTVEEAHHFVLLRERLLACEADYGSFVAHTGLWDMARRTSTDVLARMALVPRTLEARGLDASPAVRAKLVGIGDLESARVIDIILRDEIGHVAIGNRWFRSFCAERGLSPRTAYRELASLYEAPKPRGPFNLAARRAAGFDDGEIAELET